MKFNSRRGQKLPLIGAGIGLFVILLGGGLLSFRVDVPTNKVLIATKLHGENLPEGDFIAVKDGQKGVLLEPYNEGFHWFNPYTYQTELVDATIIGAGEVGVVTRLFGKDLPASQILTTPAFGDEAGAKEIYKGIIGEPLKPGKYNINTRAYMVEKFAAVKVPPGYVGVSVKLAAPMSKDPSETVYTSVGKSFKGVDPEPRQPRTYYLNPYTDMLVLYEIRAQRFDFTRTKKTDNSIDFQSSDAFSLNMEGTIEWSVEPARAPELLCRINELGRITWPWFKKIKGPMVANLQDIANKVLVPYMRSHLRMLGAKYKASEYISGERRMEIQTEFKDRLTDKCKEFGVIIANVSIRKIVPPSLVKQIINDRSQQQERRNKITQDIAKIQSDAKLAKKREAIRKGQRMVEAKTTAEKQRIAARQERNEKVKEAESRLAVAAINLEKAQTEIDVYTIKEKAKIDQTFQTEKAEVEALRLEVNAAGGGSNYIRSIYLSKLGTGLGSIVTSDDSGFMKVFEQLMGRGSDDGGAIGPQLPAAGESSEGGAK